MARVTIDWQRSREYGATVDTDDLRTLLARLPGSERDTALRIVDAVDVGTATDYDLRKLARIIEGTEAGQEYLAWQELDAFGNCGGTGAAGIGTIRPALRPNPITGEPMKPCGHNVSRSCDCATEGGK